MMNNLRIRFPLASSVILGFLFILTINPKEIKADTNGSEPDTAWINFYGSEKLSGEIDIADMTTDAAGNVYFTGRVMTLLSCFNFLTIKYNASGEKLWEVDFDGGGNGDDRANAIHVDAAGNVYVCGGADDANLDRAFTTIKYNANGQQQWVASFQGRKTGETDAAYALAMDDSSNIIVTGYSGDYKEDAYTTIKYNNAGEQQWVARYDGPISDGRDQARHIAIDKSGFIYVSGFSEGNNTRRDYATIKYAPDGTELWVARYDNPAHGTDQPSALTVSDSGYVYVTGNSYNSARDYDIVTVKYDVDGSELWTSTYNGVSKDNDNARALALNDDGEVFVTGYSYAGATKNDFLTLKYSAQGSELWVNTYNNPADESDYAYYIGQKNNGNIIVAGSSAGLTAITIDPDGNTLEIINDPTPKSISLVQLDVDGNFIAAENNYTEVGLVKMNTTGTLEWSATEQSPRLSDEHPNQIELDYSHINVIVSGFTRSDDTGTDYSLVKYDSLGKLIWSASYNGPDSSTDYATGMVVDHAGNIYQTGYSTVYGSNSVWATVKYNSLGEQQWEARFDGGADYVDQANDLAIDPSGNVYVTGNCTRIPSSYNRDLAVLKYDPDGLLIWDAYYDSPEALTDDGTCIAVDDSGNVYVSGYTNTISGTSDILTLKFDPSGNELWQKTYNGPGNGSDIATKIAIDFEYNLIVCGTSKGDGTYQDYVTIKYSSSGEEKWIQRYDGDSNGSDKLVDMEVNRFGDIFITGSARDSETGLDVVTIKYNSDGEKIWESKFDGIYQFDEPTGLSVVADNVVYVTGHSSGYNDNYDFVTHKINPDGHREWEIWHDVQNEWSGDIAADKNGNIYITGRTYASESYSRAVVIKYKDEIATGISDFKPNTIQSFNLFQNYPNPFNPTTAISYQLSAVSRVDLSIFNMLGQKVQTLVDQMQAAGHHTVNWDASAFASGIYFYRLESASQIQIRKMMLLK